MPKASNSTSELPGGAWLVPLLLGVISGLGFMVVADGFFDGRARSLLFPQAMFLAAGFGMLYALRAGDATRGHPGWQTLILLAGFYGAWAAMYLVIVELVPGYE